MNNNRNTLVRRFWSHVFNQPDDVSTLVKNGAPAKDTYVSAPAVGYPGMTPVVITIDNPPYRGVTWKGAGYIVAEIMLFLQSQGVKRGDKVAILSWNCPEWLWADIAIQSLGAVTVPIYPNSENDQVDYILADSGAKVLLADDTEQTAKVSPSSGVATHLFSEAVALAHDYTGAQLAKITPVPKPAPMVVRPQASQLVENIRRDFSNPQADNGCFLGVSRDSLATLIYTSGSTGEPKGTMILHETIASACEALERHGFNFTKDDLYLSYLPLAHVYERIVSTLCIWAGVRSAYCRVDEFADVAKEIKPTILIGVPKVWRKIKAKVEDELGRATGLRRKIVDWAFAQKQPGWKRCIADFLVFKKIRAALGGRVRLMLSGGAPISRDILDFFDNVGWMLREGYGLTESVGPATVNSPASNKTGSVGRPLDCVEVRIEKIFGEDNKTGVIWLRGSSITPGYWNLPEANSESFDEDGWFNTGDIGFIDEDGFVWITGRKKRLLKTDGGKYVAPEKLERAFDEEDELVQYVVPVGDGMPFIGALIFLTQDRAAQILDGTSLPEGDRAAFYATNPTIVAAVEKIVGAANDKLQRWETIKQFTIVPVEATVDNGLLTNKLSIRTEQVLERFDELVDEIYTREKPE